MNLLFLGDSITDAYHCFTPDSLGNGYVKMVSDSLKSTIPDLTVDNKGMDGFTVSSVYRIWQRYPFKESTDAVSVLAGVNDAGIWMNCGYSTLQCQQALEEFTAVYTDLVCDILDYGIPKIILIEPFIFPVPEKYKLWQPSLQSISAAVLAIARRYSLSFLSLQRRFDEEAFRTGYNNITADGIHLTPAGNRLLADAWLQEFKKEIK